MELDDFKLYPTGVSSSLDLYETSRGRKLTDVATPRTEDTAYRFTWMNAGDTQQVARIYDEKSGTILQRIDMAPGLDGVATDVLKVSNGQELKLAVNVREKTAADEGAGNVGDNINDLFKTEDENLNNGGGDPIVPGGDTGENDIPEDTGANTPEEPVDTDKKGMSGGVIALIVILGLAVLAGGGYCAYIFVVKPKLAAKTTQETTDETTEE